IGFLYRFFYIPRFYSFNNFNQVISFNFSKWHYSNIGVNILIQTFFCKLNDSASWFVFKGISNFKFQPLFTNILEIFYVFLMQWFILMTIKFIFIPDNSCLF